MRKYAEGAAFMEVTLDTNAVIALANDTLGAHRSEADREAAKYLKPLRDYYHRQRLITLSVGRTTFLEAMPKNATEPPHVIAEKIIAAAGLNIDRVQLYRSRQPIAYHCRGCNALTYWHQHDFDYAQQIRNVLTGSKKINARYYEYRQSRINDPEEEVKRKWHNHFNDIWGLFEHVSWGGDIFVTSDPDFLKKQAQLAKIAPGKIWSPKQTLEELSKMSLPLPQKPAWLPRLEIQQCISCLLKTADS
jgi:hypothetical protein